MSPTTRAPKLAYLVTSHFFKIMLALEPDSDEPLTQRPKDSRSSEHDFSVLDPTLASGEWCGETGLRLGLPNIQKLH
jgi:hypothetical protein